MGKGLRVNVGSLKNKTETQISILKAKEHGNMVPTHSLSFGTTATPLGMYTGTIYTILSVTGYNLSPVSFFSHYLLMFCQKMSE